MGLYIEGMEMPKDIEPGLVIEFADGIDGKRYARLYHYRHGGLTEWLEAVPVPPHGRLIDKDALEADISASVVFSGREGNAEIIGAKKIINRLHVAPTVLEAEEEET